MGWKDAPIIELERPSAPVEKQQDWRDAPLATNKDWRSAPTVDAGTSWQDAPVVSPQEAEVKVSTPKGFAPTLQPVATPETAKPDVTGTGDMRATAVVKPIAAPVLPTDPLAAMPPDRQKWQLEQQLSGQPVTEDRMTKVMGAIAKPLVKASVAIGKPVAESMPTPEEWKVVADAIKSGQLDKDSPYYGKPWEETYGRFKYAVTYIASLGGMLGPKGLAGELEEEAKKFTGWGQFTMPATSKSVEAALEWKVLYPALFKGAGKVIGGFNQLKPIREAGEYIARLGGIEVVKKNWPKIYEGVKSVAAAMSRGAVVGGVKAGAEAVAQGMDVEEALAHTAKGAANLAVVAGVFRTASDVDKRKYLSGLQKSLSLRLQTELDAISESQPTTRNKITLLENARRRGDKFIKEVVASEEAKLFGVQAERGIYGGKQAGSPEKAIERFMKHGTETVRRTEFSKSLPQLERFEKAPEHLRSPELKQAELSKQPSSKPYVGRTREWTREKPPKGVKVFKERTVTQPDGTEVKEYLREYTARVDAPRVLGVKPAKGSPAAQGKAEYVVEAVNESTGQRQSVPPDTKPNQLKPGWTLEKTPFTAPAPPGEVVSSPIVSERRTANGYEAVTRTPEQAAALAEQLTARGQKEKWNATVTVEGTKVTVSELPSTTPQAVATPPAAGKTQGERPVETPVETVVPGASQRGFVAKEQVRPAEATTPPTQVAPEQIREQIEEINQQYNVRVEQVEKDLQGGVIEPEQAEDAMRDLEQQRQDAIAEARQPTRRTTPPAEAAGEGGVGATVLAESASGITIKTDSGVVEIKGDKRTQEIAKKAYGVTEVTAPAAPTAEKEATPEGQPKQPDRYHLITGRAKSYVIDRSTASIVQGSRFQGRGHAKNATAFYDKLTRTPEVAGITVPDEGGRSFSIGDTVTISAKPSTGHLEPAAGKTGKIIDIHTIRGKASSWAVDIGGEEFIVDTAKDMTGEAEITSPEGQAPHTPAPPLAPASEAPIQPKTYTSLPDYDTLEPGDIVKAGDTEYSISLVNNGYVIKQTRGKFTSTKGDPIKGWEFYDAYKQLEEMLKPVPSEGKIPLDITRPEAVEYKAKGEGHEAQIEERPTGVRDNGLRPLEGVSPEVVPLPAGKRHVVRPVVRGGGGGGAIHPESAGEAGVQPADGLSRSGGSSTEDVDTSTRRGRRARRAGENLPRLDYRITKADQIGKGGAKTKYHSNVAAIKLLKQIEGEGRTATAAEQAVLVKYVGWGGMPQVFGERSDEWKTEHAELKNLLTEEEYEAARASTPNAHYTSFDVIGAMWEGLERLGFKGGRINEPSMGVGHFYGLMPDSIAAKSRLYGVELDSISGRIARQLYQSADVRIAGFEKTKYPDDYFDLFISNVPFGNYIIYDEEMRTTKFQIHDFFFAKALKKTRPGGLVAFITSKGTLDKVNSHVRQYLSKQADLLGAIRLPNTAFKENANTEVVTDMLIFQKRQPKKGVAGESFLALDKLKQGGQTFEVNEYFVRHPDHILGTLAFSGSMYRADEMTVEPREGLDVGKGIVDIISNISPTEAINARLQKLNDERHEADYACPAPDFVKEGAYVIQTGKVFRNRAGMLQPVAGPQAFTERLKRLIQVRDALRDLIHKQLDDSQSSEAVESAREDLKGFYRETVKTYGPVSSPTNQRAFHNDPDLPMLLSLETYDPVKAKVTKLADIFTKRTQTPYRVIEHADSPDDALTASMTEKGAVDLDYMSILLDQSTQEVADELAGKIYLNPATMKYELAELYLAGNVRSKLKEAQEAVEQTGDVRYEHNVEALEKVQPEEEQEEEGEEGSQGVEGGGYGTVGPSAKPRRPSGREELEEARKTVSVLDDLLKIASPAHRGDTARVAGRILRKGAGTLRQRDAANREQLKRYKKRFVLKSREEVLEFYDCMESGTPQKNAADNEVAAKLRQLLDDRRQLIQKYGKLKDFYENYFPHIWQKPDKAKSIIAQFVGKRPFEGSKSFLKKRTIMTIREGVERGLKPVSDNPIDLALLKLHEMDKYIMAQEVIRELKDRGLLKFVYARSRPPEGYRKINDSAFTVYMPPEITVREAYDKHMVENLTAFAESIGIDAKRFMRVGGKRWGFAEGKETVRTKFAGPESVLVHEIGHVLGNRYNLYEWMTTGSHTAGAVGDKTSAQQRQGRKKRVQIRTELRALADARYEDEEVPAHFKTYVRRRAEKEAVMLEAFLHAPEKMKEVAPTVHRLFTKFLNDHTELRPLLDISPSLVLGTGEGKIKVPGVTELGKYYAPEQAALIINNYLSPGLRASDNKLVAMTYDGLRMAGNALNQANLGLSLFHMINTGTDAMASTLGLGLRKLTATKGQKVSGIINIATAPVAPLMNLWRGHNLLREYAKQLDTIKDPKTRHMIEAIIASGGAGKMDAYYYNQAVAGVVNNIQQIARGAPMEKVKGAVKLPFNIVGSALEVVAKPVMEWWVPRLKLGVFSVMAQHEMERHRTQDLSDDKLWDSLTQVWDNVDNRMGQLVYDNLFWSKTLKDVLMLAVRSVGWNLGSWREYAGGILDIGRTYTRVKGGDAWLSHKTSYFIGAILIYCMLGAVIQKILTGKGPEETKDYFFPKTGHKNADGSDERISLPTYAKDWYAYSYDPVKTAQHKLHPLWSALAETAYNEDFYGTEIRHPDDPIYEQVKDTAAYLAKQFTPFSVRSYLKLKTTGAPTLNALATAATGIVPAPASITRSPAQKIMTERLAARVPKGSRTKEEFERSQTRKTIRGLIRRGEPVDRETFMAFSPANRRQMVKEAQLTPFQASFNKLPLEDALDVYEAANAKERNQVAPLLDWKVRNADPYKLGYEEQVARSVGLLRPWSLDEIIGDSGVLTKSHVPE